MPLQKLHHVAYRCKDAAATHDFYTQALGLKYAMAIAEDNVPSTGERSPYFHLFFEMADGSYIAFFEVPESPPMGKDPNTPAWVQHLALEVEDEAALAAGKARLEAHGVDVLGPVDHGICKSIYFFDPSGHRLELSARTTTPAVDAANQAVAEPMLADWLARKRREGWA
jgi:catechol 2,3-dioxygenase-like lactoylglutathione lyase family enzyme